MSERICVKNSKKAYKSLEDLVVQPWLIKPQKANFAIWVYEDFKYEVEYFDMFFAYENKIMKAERTVFNKVSKESTYWRAWIPMRPNSVREIFYENLGFSLPEAIDEVEFDLWLRLELCNKNNWLFL